MRLQSISPFVFLTGLILVVSLACGILTPVQPDSITLLNPNTLPQSGDLIYSTVFNDLPNWTAYTKEDLETYTLEGRDEGLYFVVPGTEDYIYIYYDKISDYSDVRLEADIELTGGTNYTYFSLICRSSIEEEYYFTLDAGGYWQIGKFVDGEYTRLTSGGSTAIRVAKAKNHMTGICEENTLTFLINGEEIGRIEDYSLTSGSVGFAIKTFDYARAEGFLHNFEVYVP